MKVRDILEKINQIAPVMLAEEWDNVGLMVGDPDMSVQRLALALDPLPEVVDEAFRKGCQALLTHHPLFFTPIRKLDFSSTSGQTVRLAVRAEMAILAAHTNWDNAENGVSRTLAKRLRLNAIVPLRQSEHGIGGSGAAGEFSAVTPLHDALEKLKRAWNLSRIDYYGPADCSILRVALCGGSGGSLWPAASAMKADLYATADMKYHDILDCLRARLPVAVADHAEMESVTLVELARHLAVPGELEVMLMNYKAFDTPLRA